MLVKLVDLDDETSHIPFVGVRTSLVLDENMVTIRGGSLLMCSVNLSAAFMCLICTAAPCLQGCHPKLDVACSGQAMWVLTP